MATKRKVFEIQKRFEIWVSQEIRAETFEQAVQDGKALKVTDFVEFQEGVSQNDTTELTGFGVNERW